MGAMNTFPLRSLHALHAVEALLRFTAEASSPDDEAPGPGVSDDPAASRRRILVTRLAITPKGSERTMYNPQDYALQSHMWQTGTSIPCGRGRSTNKK